MDHVQRVQIKGSSGCAADGLNGNDGESAFGSNNGGQWSGAPILSKASMSLKKTKAAIMTDDEIDDYDWTCQGCLVSHHHSACLD